MTFSTTDYHSQEMGKCPNRKVKKRRYSHKTARLAKFLRKDILFYLLNYRILFFVFYLVEYFLLCFCFLDWEFVFTRRCRLWWASKVRFRKESLAFWRGFAWNGPILLLTLRVCFHFYFSYVCLYILLWVDEKLKEK